MRWRSGDMTKLLRTRARPTRQRGVRNHTLEVRGNVSATCDSIVHLGVAVTAVAVGPRVGAHAVATWLIGILLNLLRLGHGPVERAARSPGCEPGMEMCRYCASCEP